MLYMPTMILLSLIITSLGEVSQLGNRVLMKNTAYFVSG